MSLLTPRLRRRITAAHVRDWVRILPAQHRATPIGVGHGASRFSSPSNAFMVLYAADSFATAFAEAVIRDRFEGRAKRFLYRPHLDTFCVTTIASTQSLRLLDLTGAGPYEAGIDTDANRARAHGAGQLLSAAVHAAWPEVDGILFDSRLTTGACVAVYDRALHALAATPPIALPQAASLPAELARLGITVRRERGYGRNGAATPFS